MEFFKKRFSILVAALFAASLFFAVGCGDDDPVTPVGPNPDPGNGGQTGGAQVVFDNFEQRVIDDEGNTGFTTQNMIPNGGSWYAYGCAGDQVTTHDGNTDLIGGVDGMYPATGDGKLNIMIDVSTGTSYKCATVACPFFDNGAADVSTDFAGADLSQLVGVRIKGELQGTMWVGFFSNKIASGSAGSWGWSISREWSGTASPFDTLLTRASMDHNHWAGSHPIARDEYLSGAAVFIITIDTEKDEKIIASIDEVIFEFANGDAIPANLK